MQKCASNLFNTFLIFHTNFLQIVTWINTITFAINFFIATTFELLSYLKYSKICKTKGTCARNGLNENRLVCKYLF